MKISQRQNTAKYLYDLSKIIFTFAIIGNLMTRNKFDVGAFVTGIFGTVLIFLWGYRIDGKEVE